MALSRRVKNGRFTKNTSSYNVVTMLTVKIADVDCCCPMLPYSLCTSFRVSAVTETHTHADKPTRTHDLG